MMTQLECIGETCLECEYDVLEALFNSYDKALCILENYDGEDIESFQIFQEANQTVPSQGGGVSEGKPKFRFRQNDEKTGAKESILKSIIKLIPRLITHVQEVHSIKLQEKKLKKIQEQAKKINTDLSQMSPGEIELFYTIMDQNVNAKQMKEIIRKELKSSDLRKKLTKLGLKVGGGAIVIGGTAYFINNKKELIQQKVSEYSGRVLKKLDETVLDPMREVGSKVTEAANKAAEKIEHAADVCKKAMQKAIDFISKLYNAIKKFFNIHLLKYDQTSEEKVLCKIDVKTGTLYVTLDLDTWADWVDASISFVVQSARFIAYKFEKGELVRNVNDEGKAKRTGNLVDAQKDHDTSDRMFFKGPDASDVLNKYIKGLQSLVKKTNAKQKYQPIEEFGKQAEKLVTRLKKLCEKSRQLSDIYEKRIANDSRSDKFFSIEKEISQTLRGIFETQLQITNSIDAVNEYIDSVAQMSDSLGVGDVSDDKE